MALANNPPAWWGRWGLDSPSSGGGGWGSQQEGGGGGATFYGDGEGKDPWGEASWGAGEVNPDNPAPWVTDPNYAPDPYGSSGDTPVLAGDTEAGPENGPGQDPWNLQDYGYDDYYGEGGALSQLEDMYNNPLNDYDRKAGGIADDWAKGLNQYDQQANTGYEDFAKTGGLNDYDKQAASNYDWWSKTGGLNDMDQANKSFYGNMRDTGGLNEMDTALQDAATANLYGNTTGRENEEWGTLGKMQGAGMYDDKVIAALDALGNPGAGGYGAGWNQGTGGMPASWDKSMDAERKGKLEGMLNNGGYSPEEAAALSQEGMLSARAATDAARAAMTRQAARSGNTAGQFGAEAALGMGEANTLGNQARQNVIQKAAMTREDRDKALSGLSDLSRQFDTRSTTDAQLADSAAGRLMSANIAAGNNASANARARAEGMLGLQGMRDTGLLNSAKGMNTFNAQQYGKTQDAWKNLQQVADKKTSSQFAGAQGVQGLANKATAGSQYGIEGLGKTGETQRKGVQYGLGGLAQSGNKLTGQQAAAAGAYGGLGNKYTDVRANALGSKLGIGNSAGAAAGGAMGALGTLLGLPREAYTSGAGTTGGAGISI